MRRKIYNVIVYWLYIEKYCMNKYVKFNYELCKIFFREIEGKKNADQRIVNIEIFRLLHYMLILIVFIFHINIEEKDDNM